MQKNEIEIFYPTSQTLWRKWLQESHLSKQAVWLVFYNKQQKEQLVQNSNFDWTIARPVGLNNNEIFLGQLVVTHNKTPKPFKMSRKQLAKFMIDNLNRTEFIHKTTILSKKS